jgi:hypothetical protein
LITNKTSRADFERFVALSSDVRAHNQRLFELENGLKTVAASPRNDGNALTQQELARHRGRLDQDQDTFAKMREAWKQMAARIAAVEARVATTNADNGVP